jgi:hypothetical protein
MKKGIWAETSTGPGHGSYKILPGASLQAGNRGRSIMNHTLFSLLCIVCLLLAGSVSAAGTGTVGIAIGAAMPTDGPGVLQSPLSGLLQTPVLVSPGNGTTFTSLPRKSTLAWRPVPGADGYRVEIVYFVNSSWAPLATGTISGQNASFYQFEFPGNDPALWRVTALGSTSNYIHIESLPSPWWSFSWDTQQTLATPVLVSPGGGAVFSHYPRVMTLAWNPVPGATGYLVERDILTESAWSPYPDITVTGEPNSSCTIDFGTSGTSRWRVTAIDGSMYGNATSGWWQFTFLN